MATAVQQLETIKASLLASLVSETAYQELNGPRPDYNLDGEGYQWVAWREAVLRKVETINRLIQQEQPYFLSSRGRS